MTRPVEILWVQFGSQLADYICRKTDQQDHCYDILHEVYIKLATNVEKISKACNVQRYLLKLAQNAVIDYYRTNPPRTILHSASYNLAVAENEINSPTSELAHSWFSEFIHALPPIYKQALLRTEIDGISQIQLAEELGISYSGAKSRVQRAKLLLRQSMVNCCDYKFDKYGNVISCCGAAV